MPIQPGLVSEAAITAVQMAMSERAIRSAFVTQRLQGANARSLSRSTPHRVTYLPVDELRGSDSLRESLRPAGWRFLLHEHDNEAIAAIRVVETNRDTYHLAELSEGLYVTGTEYAIRFSEQLDIVRTGQFVAVLVMVPELQIVALLLQDLNGDSDLVLIVPGVANSAAKPALGKPMTPSDFIGFLLDLAAARN